MPEGVAACDLGYASGADGLFDGILKIFLTDMVPASFVAPRIDRRFIGGKDILPAPFPGGIGIFALQGKGKIDGATAVGEIALMQEFNALEV